MCECFQVYGDHYGAAGAPLHPAHHLHEASRDANEQDNSWYSCMALTRAFQVKQVQKGNNSSGLGELQNEKEMGRQNNPNQIGSFQPNAVNCSGTKGPPEMHVWVHIYILHGPGHHAHKCLWQWEAEEANTSCRNKTAACGQGLFQLLQRTRSGHKVTFSP